MTKSKKRKPTHPPPSITNKRRKAGHPSLPEQKSSLNTKLRPPQHSLQHAKPTIPFSSTDRILLIGEGDFSFALSLLTDHACHHVTATCLDDESALFSKYPQARQYVKELGNGGARIVYGVDGTKLGSLGKKLGLKGRRTGKKRRKVEEDARQDRDLERELDNDDDYDDGRTEGEGWDRVIFNFPHVGGKTKDVNRQVRYNQELLVSFFRSAIPLLKARRTSETNSSIIVTLFEGEPYTLWNVRDLARHVGLKIGRSFRFQAQAYPTYRHARTLGNVVAGHCGGEEGAFKGDVIGVGGEVDDGYDAVGVEDGDGEGDGRSPEEGLPGGMEQPGGGRRGWKGEERMARSYILEVDDGRGDAMKERKRKKGRGQDSDSQSDEN
ncbi:MAG: hypothetical protein M1837_001695 [Sclerophora amabilis]|nr:MAG: hypothetical protein M1837_001695 [Sclerophora amabilis]